MSSKDDPFGSGGKTVIRPNPGGALRPEQFKPSPMPGSSNGNERPSEPTVFAPQQARQPAPGAPGRQDPASPFADPAKRYSVPDAEDDWMKGGAGSAFFPGSAEPGQPVEPVEKIPLEVALNARDGGEYSAANPITTAAAPLLILLGRLRLMIIDMQAVPLMNHVANAIREFERKVTEAGVPAEDVRIAKYALCGTADDIVQNLPGTDRHVWMQYSMLAQFFQVRTSGVGFFEALNKLLANPAQHFDLLELMHACLSLGFEGQYRGMAGGDRDLQRVRRDVYETLRHLKSRPDEDISPRWQGMAKLMSNLGPRIPLWAIAAAVIALLAGIYFLLRLLIGNDGDALADKLLALNPNEPITIERAAFTPYVEELRDQTQLERIRAALAPEIAAGGLDVVGKGDFIVVEINNLLLFASGRAEVKDEFAPIADRIAAALEPEPGPIRIIGHTDIVKPKRSSAFKSNYDLSVARAKSVAAVIEPKISDPSRLAVEGRGEDDPVADNATPEGRAKNRRVDLMIPREETLNLTNAAAPQAVQP
ncbi:type VI secretion system protein TssL, long form [Arvimicrobium flavum]|uniref:type VI secretion system protein TssL, long form n=1 Tax=Arvimicrobium flavum TaxID=3393320 RepID=UPI00237C0149|nr:type VI secretion system protein TssL, long form [Mesorhizobium shangrilense]